MATIGIAAARHKKTAAGLDNSRSDLEESVFILVFSFRLIFRGDCRNRA
jgi:hypothetical protein